MKVATPALALILIVIACAGQTGLPPAIGYVVEVAKFRKRANVSESDFVAAVRSIDSFAKKQPGFISRETGPDGKGGWIDVVRWRDNQSAQAAMKASEQSPICQKAFALLDPKYEEMNHITVTHRFAK